MLFRPASTNEIVEKAKAIQEYRKIYSRLKEANYHQAEHSAKYEATGRAEVQLRELMEQMQWELIDLILIEASND